MHCLTVCMSAICFVDHAPYTCWSTSNGSPWRCNQHTMSCVFCCTWNIQRRYDWEYSVCVAGWYLCYLEYCNKVQPRREGPRTCKAKGARRITSSKSDALTGNHEQKRRKPGRLGKECLGRWVWKRKQVKHNILPLIIFLGRKGKKKKQASVLISG